MKVLGIIPARYESTRFPGKPLIDLAGKPMIQHVVEQSMQSNLLNEIIVATDDDRILKVVEGFGGNAVFTSPEHTSGTSRCAEVVSTFAKKFDYVINIQGDEPLIQPSQIDSFYDLFAEQSTQLATLARKITTEEQLNSPNVVKVIKNQRGEAIYFSRSVIPFNRTGNITDYLQHIGIYGYRVDILQEIVKLSPTPLEQSESLEQLRWLENGYRIRIGLTNEPTFAIDCPEDVEIVLSQMKKYG